MFFWQKQCKRHLKLLKFILGKISGNLNPKTSALDVALERVMPYKQIENPLAAILCFLFIIS